jgi:hypothetical protein
MAVSCSQRASALGLVSLIGVCYLAVVRVVTEKIAKEPTARESKMGRLKQLCEKKAESLSEIYLGYCVDNRYDAHPRVKRFAHEQEVKRKAESAKKEHEDRARIIVSANKVSATFGEREGKHVMLVDQANTLPEVQSSYNYSPSSKLLAFVITMVGKQNDPTMDGKKIAGGRMAKFKKDNIMGNDVQLQVWKASNGTDESVRQEWRKLAMHSGRNPEDFSKATAYRNHEIGCHLSHQHLFEHVLGGQYSKVNEFLVFEDDAVCVKDWDARFKEFLQIVPSDWDVRTI